MRPLEYCVNVYYLSELPPDKRTQYADRLIEMARELSPKMEADLHFKYNEEGIGKKIIGVLTDQLEFANVISANSKILDPLIFANINKNPEFLRQQSL